MLGYPTLGYQTFGYQTIGTENVIDMTSIFPCTLRVLELTLPSRRQSGPTRNVANSWKMKPLLALCVSFYVRVRGTAGAYF